MKATLASTGLLLVLCALAGAQDTTGSRLVVPARNPSHPRVINCNVLNGSITIKTHGGTEVIVEEPSGARAGGSAATHDGMKRIDVSMRGLEVVEDDNVIRSEEHTSELQSLRHLVCRLLLEKNKNTISP